VPFFATSSEDCLIKIWNSSKFIKEEVPEPVHTLRKHTGPLFSLTSCQNPHNSSEVYLFSGGIEGDIKSWKMTPGQAHWTKCWLNGTEEEQTIW
jgi:WD40 repeat protein